MTPPEALTAIARRLTPGVRFPEWAVPTGSGHLIALVSRVPADPHRPWRVLTVVRRATLETLTDAGLLHLGDEEPVPEYEGGARGLRWEQGRVGFRCVRPGEE